MAAWATRWLFTCTRFSRSASEMFAAGTPANTWLVTSSVRNYVSGSYRQIDTGTIVSALGVLLYTLSPIDLVPDFIPVVGFLDDLALLSWFVEKFQGEITRFREWEKTHAAEETDDIPAATAQPVYAASNTNAENAPAVAEMGHS